MVTLDEARSARARLDRRPRSRVIDPILSGISLPIKNDVKLEDQIKKAHATAQKYRTPLQLGSYGIHHADSLEETLQAIKDQKTSESYEKSNGMSIAFGSSDDEVDEKVTNPSVPLKFVDPERPDLKSNVKDAYELAKDYGFTEIKISMDELFPNERFEWNASTNGHKSPDKNKYSGLIKRHSSFEFESTPIKIDLSKSLEENLIEAEKVWSGNTKKQELYHEAYSEYQDTRKDYAKRLSRTSKAASDSGADPNSVANADVSTASDASNSAAQSSTEVKKPHKAKTAPPGLG